MQQLYRRWQRSHIKNPGNITHSRIKIIQNRPRLLFESLYLFVKVWLGVVRIVLPVFDFIRKLLRFALKA